MKLFSTLLITILSVVSGSCFCQNAKSGINTKNPQQALHISGAKTAAVVGTSGDSVITPTIRIDGLNYSNNTANRNDPNSLKRVYATQNGDLVLVDSSLEQLTYQQLGDAIIPNTALTSTSGASIESVSLKALTFTLNEPSVVNISASVNVQFQTLPTDGAPRIYGAYFRFSAVPAGSGISTTGNFGRNEKFYTNAAATGTTGDYMISPRADILLPKGTYTVNLYGHIQGGPSTFTVNFANSINGGENLIVTATPTQFQ